MPALPRKPQPGERVTVLPKIIGDLIDYVRSITPRSSATIAVSTTAQGTTFTNKAKPTTKTAGGGGASFRSLSLTYQGIRTHKKDDDDEGTPYFIVTPGAWVHRYEVHEADDTIGDSNPFENDTNICLKVPDLQEGTLYLYIELDDSGDLSIGTEWDEYPTSSALLLRRTLAGMECEKQKNADDEDVFVLTRAMRHSVGDIHTW